MSWHMFRITAMLYLVGLVQSASADLLIAQDYWYPRGNILRYSDEGEYLGVFNQGVRISPVALAVGPGGDVFAATSPGNVFRYDGGTGAFLGEFISPEEHGIPINKHRIIQMSFDPQLENLLVLDEVPDYLPAYNGRVERFDAITGDKKDDLVPASALSGGLGYPRGIAIGPDGQIYASSLLTKEILRYDGRSGEWIDVFARWDSETPLELAFRNDIDLFVDLSGDIIQLDAKTGTPKRTVTASNRPTQFVVGPDGLLYYTTDFGNNLGIVVWNPETGETVRSFGTLANVSLLSDIVYIPKVPLECDLDGDGAVDAADAGIMFSAWGATLGSPADKNNNGLVDAQDAGIMFGEWTGDNGPMNVPEPSTSVLANILLLGGLSARRHLSHG